MMISAGDLLIIIHACMESNGVVFRLFFLPVIKFKPHFLWKGQLKIGKLSGPVSETHVSIFDFRSVYTLHSTLCTLHFTLYS